LTIKIHTIQDAINSVYNAGLERGEILFRGQVNCQWNIKPSLFRNKAFGIADKYETVLYEHLLSGNHSIYTLSFDPIEHLILLQHFDINTRLLDWTYDVLVALFFSCYDPNNFYEQIDGNLIFVQKNHFPQYPMNSSDKHIFKTIRNTDEYFNLFGKRTQINQVFVLEPLIKNPRMRRQDGVFMIFPFYPLSLDDKCYASLELYVNARNKLIKEINSGKPEQEQQQLVWIMHKLVDKDSKKNILIELDEKYGISFESLFIENDIILKQKEYFEQIKTRADYKLEWLLKSIKK
jgi:hypothetical protein